MRNLSSVERPCALPYCAYPRADDIEQHGLQNLPAALPIIDFTRSEPYRSRHYFTRTASSLSSDQVLQTVNVVGASFARREPQVRHLQPPRNPPDGLMEAIHADPFGRDRFGPWTSDRLMYWFIRLLVLTDPTQPKYLARVNEEALAQSLAIIDKAGQVIGGAWNEPMPAFDRVITFREGDLFLNAVLSFVAPIMILLTAQDAEALTALCQKYPAFRDAYAQGLVGHHFMVARSDTLPKADAFELVAASAEHFQALGYRYMVVEASNQWTGAACEILGGIRVHFAPYQARYRVSQSAKPLDDVVTSANGWLSDKDSGCMFYVIRLI